MKWVPWDYQKHAIKHVLDNNSCGLFLDMGLGKTAIILSVINRLMYEELEINKVLVIAPLRVAKYVWLEERDKWSHLHHLKLSLVLGYERDRKAALKQAADIYVINRENIAWLVRQYQTNWPFDMVVIDELSSFKSPKSVRFKALRMVIPASKRVVGLTGTPAPNGLIDLWSQMYLLDQGARLEKNVTTYRTKYFSPGLTQGFTVFRYDLRPGAKEIIYRKISDICISMRAKDYIKMPKRIDNFIDVYLSDEEQKQYNDFERDAVMRLYNEAKELLGEITAINAAVLTNKLLQWANGAVFDSKRDWHEVHERKLDALEEIIDGLQGKPMLIAYSYKHDVERIIKRFKAKKMETKQDQDDWNNGKIPLMIMHPASGGHGLNLQYTDSVITWFGLTWSLELDQQFNARVHRQGRKETVVINRIVTHKTMDQDVMAAIRRKTHGQEALLEAVKARIRKYIHDA